MENTVLIADRLYVFASAFFRVDNSEWINSHELVYEDNEDELVNRLNAKIGKVYHRIGDLFMSVISVILKIYNKKITPNILNILKENILRKLFSKFIMKYDASDGSSMKSLKNYNGFYSGRIGGSDKKPQQDDDFLTKIRNFLALLFKQIQPKAREVETYRPKRMYRGNSLD